MNEPMRRCPFCAEEIQPAAVVCKHCRSDLRAKSQRQPIGALGVVIVLTPLVAAVPVVFWIPQMSTTTEAEGASLAISLATILVSAVFIVAETIVVGAGKEKGDTHGPSSWFAGALLLWFLAFPAWLKHRSRYGRPSLLWPGIASMVIYLGSFVWLPVQRELQARAANKAMAERVDGLAPYPRTPSPMPLRGAAAATRAAADVWARFDLLSGDELRTKDMLVAYLLRANELNVGLTEDETTELDRANGVAFRRRFPPILMRDPYAEARGADALAIAPSRDPARCDALARSWIGNKTGQMLIQMGYVEVYCPTSSGSSATFHLAIVPE